MAKPSRQTRTPTADVVSTSGEIFPDGSVIELVSSPIDGRINLLFWRKNRNIIGPRIEYRDRIYKSPDVGESLRRAIRLPKDAADYSSSKELFAEIRSLFGRYIGLNSLEGSLMTAWICSTWLADCVSSPPPLIISGPDISAAINFFRLLRSLCRRPVILADINRSAFLSLVALQPTLLVSQASGSLKILELWETSNYRGVHVIGSGGKVHQVAGSKAMFVGMGETSITPAVYLALPGQPPLPPLDEASLAKIADRLQPKLLMYRLRNFRAVCEPCNDLAKVNFPNSELARTLSTCVQGEPEIVQAISSMLKRQEQDAQARRGCDVALAALEVIWGPMHSSKEITVNQITESANALLRCRGEVLGVQRVGGWMETEKFRSLPPSQRGGDGLTLFGGALPDRSSADQAFCSELVPGARLPDLRFARKHGFPMIVEM